MSTSTVLVTIHAPTVPIVSERRLPSDIPLRSILDRLELLTGIPPEAQRISFWTSRTDDADSHSTLVKDASDDASVYAKTLSELQVRDGMGIKIQDTRSSELRDQFGAEEEEKVEKYEMDDEAYSKRTGEYPEDPSTPLVLIDVLDPHLQDSVLAYKVRNKMGRFGSKPQQPQGGEETESLPSEMQTGSRCQVEGGRRGTIRHVGETEFAKGVWIGVEYDEPVGKNDGSVGGKRYFTCRANFGGFVRAEKVQVGDFPERGLDDEDEDEEM